MPQQERLATPKITPFSLAQLGQRFGIRYRIESPTSPRQPVATGHVHDVSLRHGIHLTLSDLQVERGYTSTSYQSVPWFFSIILELGPLKICQTSQRVIISLCTIFIYQYLRNSKCVKIGFHFILFEK